MRRTIAVTMRMKCLLCITGALILLGLTATLAYADTNAVLYVSNKASENYSYLLPHLILSDAKSYRYAGASDAFIPTLPFPLPLFASDLIHGPYLMSPPT